MKTNKQKNPRKRKRRKQKQKTKKTPKAENYCMKGRRQIAASSQKAERKIQKVQSQQLMLELALITFCCYSDNFRFSAALSFQNLS